MCDKAAVAKPRTSFQMVRPHAAGGALAGSHGASIVRTLRLLRRALRLALIFLPAAITAPVVFFVLPLTPRVLSSWLADANTESHPIRVAWIRTLKGAFVAAGPALIKWGQWAAARPDVFPHDAVAVFSELHMSCPKHAFRHTKRIVEEAFGVPFHEVFASFEKEPMASGSIGQVHVATLTASAAAATGVAPNTEVAVKVRHPGVAETLDVDFALLLATAGVLSHVPQLSWMHLDESVGQFGDVLFAQAKLGDEATKLVEFRQNFRRWTDNVRFPEPLYPLVSDAVLVESLEVGVPVNVVADGRDARAGDSLFASPSGVSTCRSITARLGLTCVLKMLLVDNLVHADLHPGNILVAEHVQDDKPATWYQKLFWRWYRGGYGPSPTLIFLDTGMTASLTERDKLGLLDMFRGINDLDGTKCADAMLKISRTNPKPEDVLLAEQAAFRADLRRIFQGFVDEHGSDGSWRCFGEAIAMAIESLRQYERYVEGGVCTVLVTSLMLSDLQRRLDPGVHAMDVLKDVLLGVAVSEYVPGMQALGDRFVASRATKILGFTSEYYKD